ncbi:riboflavin biosynthesis pyrimidine reductase [Haloactinospora alba]|uniref:Riboflavin biosynthesis pyrimidine reductase n=1 Tax=Haloactinospora alba TaxID=405555 RepID=A0A543NJ67_9ACTN|nr:pyrimidine reductase family protein [Haloactinospora alba]TQN31891.1 riboflavin biosynthesis pyrimidine reductase [Haloactinospora alba]
MNQSSATGAARFRALLPASDEEPGLATAYAYPGELTRPWLRANMVTSVDGGAWGPSGRTAELSAPADRAVMSVLRGQADVVLAGAATARIEGYRPVRPREVFTTLRAGRSATPPVAIITRTLDVHPDLLHQAPQDAPTIVFTTESAPEAKRREVSRVADLVVAGTESVRPEEVLSALAARGMFRVLTEGGPQLLSEFTSAGLVDELCLTVAPHLIGPAASRIVAGDAPSHTQDLRLRHVLESEGTLFLRYTAQ